MALAKILGEKSIGCISAHWLHVDQRYTKSICSTSVAQVTNMLRICTLLLLIIKFISTNRTQEGLIPELGGVVGEALR